MPLLRLQAVALCRRENIGIDAMGIDLPHHPVPNMLMGFIGVRCTLLPASELPSVTLAQFPRNTPTIYSSLAQALMSRRGVDREHSRW
jgi:hypothetical protein